MRDVVLFGKCGSGKDTLAKHIVNKYNYIEINTGNIFREMADRGDEKGVELKNKYWAGGNLVPDGEVSELVKRYVLDVKNANLVFNGFPRSEHQLQYLINNILGDRKVLFIILNITDETAFERLGARGRQDDTPEVIARRLEVYKKNMNNIPKLLAKKYKMRVLNMNAEMPIEDIRERFDGALRDA